MGGTLDVEVVGDTIVDGDAVDETAPIEVEVVLDPRLVDVSELESPWPALVLVPAAEVVNVLGAAVDVVTLVTVLLGFGVELDE